MRVIERRDPPKPFWQGPWQCVTCRSIVEADHKGEIQESPGDYNQTDYYIYCPVCEMQRAAIRPPCSGLDPITPAICTKCHNTGMITKSVPNGIAVVATSCDNCGRRHVAMNLTGHPGGADENVMVDVADGDPNYARMR